MNTDAAIKSLTAKGRETMTAVGRREISFFDGGIVEGEGCWGVCFTEELGHKSSGVINRLVDLGLFHNQGHDPADGSDSGDWYTLTALGAEVALELAKPAEEDMSMGELADAIEKAQGKTPSARVGRKWTTMYDADGAIVAELRNDQLDAIKAYLGSL